MRCKSYLLTLAALIAAGGVSAAQGVPALQELSLKDIHYLPRTLKDLGEAKGYVLYFHASDCAQSEKAFPGLAAIEAEYHAQGLNFASIIHMAFNALSHGITFPLYKDKEAQAAAALSITKLPAVAILDSDFGPVFTGSPESLPTALAAFVAGQPLPASAAPAEGCDIVKPSLPAAAEPITYASHIAPFINKHCASCHHEGGNAPINLTSLKRVIGNAEMIDEVVSEGRMPPWYAHPDFGTFRDTPQISDEERVIFAQWIAAGMPEGDPAAVPPAPKVAGAEWGIEPDLVLEAKQINAIPATGYVPYQYIFLPWVAPEDTYVQAIEIKPSNPKTVHHANLIFVRDGFQVDEAKDFLTGYVPGGMPSVLDGDRAWFIPKGASLALQVHLVTTGKKEANRMSVAFRFPREVVNKKVYYFNLDGGKRFVIPPRDRAWQLTDSDVLDGDATGLGLFAHMHLRGKDVQFLAHYPDGQTELLAVLPNYNFDWQLTYRYPPGAKQFPAGTRIECIAHYDNSPFNPYNPDPDSEVRRGAQTINEMLNGFFVFTKNDENLNLRIDPRTGSPVQQVASAE
jgi:mono/diheme cytochrome c family protein